MARRFGLINKKYDSQLRRCAVSGLRFYQSEMVRVAEGRYVHPKFLDSDELKKRGAGGVGRSGGRARTYGGIPDPWTHGQHSPSATPSATASMTASSTVSATASSTQSPSATVSATPSTSPSGTPSGGSETLYIATGADDGWGYPGLSFSNNATNGTFGDSGGIEYACFFRFTGLSVPQGATIVSAYVTVSAWAANWTVTVCRAKVYFENADAPAAISSYTDWAARTWTSAVDWNPVPTFTASTQYNTPELSSILQTVVDRPGFAGSAVQVYLKGEDSDTNARRVIDSYETSGGNKPELHITWS